MKTRCCIVGGGPAGMMLGYLLGRAGVDVVVLEKHADFFRDFRGDTVHPSTLQVMDELGLIDGFLKLPHQRLQRMEGMFGGETVRIADLGRLNVKYPFIAFMPQWDFLNFLRESGRRFASLKVMMSTEAVDLIRDGERVTGVKAKTPEGIIDIEADLTIACDGRHSLVRERAGLEVEEIGAPMDVLWFRAGKREGENENLFARVDPGKMMVTFDRGDYWQCAYVIPKGQYDAVKARGLPGSARRHRADGADPEIGIGRGEELGRGEAVDGCGQPVQALDAAGAVVHRRRRACDVADRRRRRQSRGAGCGGDRQFAGGEAGGRLPAGGRTRCRPPAPRVSGQDDAADAGRRAEQYRQRRAEARQCAAKRPAGDAARHRRALAAGHHGAICRPWRAARACASPGG